MPRRIGCRVGRKQIISLPLLAYSSRSHLAVDFRYIAAVGIILLNSWTPQHLFGNANFALHLLFQGQYYTGTEGEVLAHVHQPWNYLRSTLRYAALVRLLWPSHLLDLPILKIACITMKLNFFNDYAAVFCGRFHPRATLCLQRSQRLKRRQVQECCFPAQHRRSLHLVRAQLPNTSVWSLYCSTLKVSIFQGR